MKSERKAAPKATKKKRKIVCLCRPLSLFLTLSGTHLLPLSISLGRRVVVVVVVVFAAPQKKYLKDYPKLSLSETSSLGKQRTHTH